MEGELIYLGIISTFGMLLAVELMNHNWFKREKWKLHRKTIDGEIKLRLRKMEKELNLKPGKITSKEEQTPMELAKKWLPLLKNLDADSIDVLKDVVLGGGELPEEAGGLMSILDNIPPDFIEAFLKGLGGKGETEAPGEFKGQDEM